MHWREEKLNDPNPSVIGHLVNNGEYIGKLSLVVSLFTMQFLPENERLRLFKKIYDNLQDGGATFPDRQSQHR